MRSLLLWFVSALVVFSVATILWLSMADLGFLKPKIEQWVSDSTGRQFAIDGNLTIDLGRHGTLIAEDIRLQNADWADDPQMLVIGSVELRIDLWSLVIGPVIVELVAVRDAEVHLALVEGQSPNWQFSGQDVPAPADSEEPRRGFRVLQVDLDDIRVRYDSFERDAPLDLEIDSLTQTLRDDEWLVVDLDATLNGKPVSANGEAGSWDALLAGTNLRFDVTAQVDTLRVTAKGLLDDLRHPGRPNVEFSATAPDIDDLTRLLGIGEEGEGDIRLLGKLQPDDDGPVRFSVAGNVGRAEMQGEGEFSDMQSLQNAALKLHMAAPDVGPFLRIAGVHGIQEAPFTADVDIERRGKHLEVRQANLALAGARLTAKATLPALPELTGASVDADLDGESIERLLAALDLPQVARGGFDIDLDVGAGEGDAVALKLQIVTPLGKANASGKVARGAKFSGSQFDIDADVPDVALLAQANKLDIKVPSKGLTLAGRVRLAEDGIQLHEPMAVGIGDDHVDIGGFVAFASGGRGSRLEVRAQGPSLAAFISDFGPSVELLSLPYDLTGTLRVEAAGIRIDKVGGTLGTADVSVDGLLNPGPGLVGSEFTADVSGPAVELFTRPLETLRIRPGPFSLSGKVEIERETIALHDVVLERPGGKAEVKLEIGVPFSRRWLDFDVRMHGRDVRDLWHGNENLELLAQDFSAQFRGTRRGELLDVDGFELSVGDASASAEGELHLDGAGNNASFHIAMDVPSIARLATLNGRRLRDQAFKLETTVSSSGGAIEARDVSASLGESDASGRLRIVPAERLHAEVAVTSESFEIGSLTEEPESPPEPMAKKGDGRIIPDIAVPFELFAKLDASFRADIGQLRYKEVALNNVDATVTLQDGILDVSALNFDGQSGKVAATLRLGPASGQGAGRLQMVARDFSLGILGNTPESHSSTDWDISLDGTGADLRAMLGSANGVIFLRRHGGRVSRGSRFLAAIYGGLLEEILDTINPMRKSSAYTELECVVVASEIIDGTLTSAPASLVSTDKLLIAVKSTVNLASEKLEVGIRTEPKRRLSVSVAELINPYIQVVGTLAAPRLAVDQQGVLLTGGAAVASGGLTILAQGLWSRLTRSSDPCAAAIADGMKTLGTRLPNLQVP